MLLSRTLAKARIARAERPGWIAAWAPVAFDAALLFGVFAVLYRPFWQFIETQSPPLWLMIAILFLGGFVPTQIILITSSLWAAKSRFKEEVPKV